MKWAKKSSIVILLWLFTILGTRGSQVWWEYSIGDITALSVSDNGNYIAVGCQSGQYYMFDTWGNLIGSGNLSAPIDSLDISNEGVLLLGSSLGYGFCTRDDSQISSFLSSPVRNVAMPAEGSYSLVCCQNNFFINRGTSMQHQREVSSSYPLGAISSNGRLACVASESSLYIFRDGAFEQPYELGEEISHLFVSEDEERLIFSTHSGKIGYLSVKDRELSSKDLGNPIKCMAVSSNGNVALLSVEDKIVWLEKDSISEYPFDDEVACLSISENGSIAAIGLRSGFIQIMKGKDLSMPAHNLGSPIVAMEMSRSGGILVACTKNSLHTFQLHQEGKSNNHFNPLSSRKVLPITSVLEEVWSIPVKEDAAFFTADVDGDGSTEIVLKEGTVVKLLDKSGNQESSRDLEIPFTLISPLDYDADTIPDISLIFNYSIFTFSIYDWRNENIRDYYLDAVRDNLLQEGRATPFAAFDIDSDGENEILASVSAGYSCKPRGIVSIDQPSGSVEWFYQTGPGVRLDAIEDIDGDGHLEVILGSVAPCNCVDDEAYPDCSTYVIALSRSGEELWNIYLGDGYRRVAVCVEDVDHSDGLEIIGFGYEASEKWGGLFVLNCNGKYLQSHETEYSIFPGIVADIDSDTDKEIITLDSRGYISVFSPDLQLESQRLIGGNINSSSQLYANDLDGDGFCEIMVGSGNELYILDKELNIIRRKSFETAIKSMQIANFGQCKNFLLVLADRLSSFSYYDPGDSPCPLWEITRQNLLQEATENVETAESAFAAGNYKMSRLQYEHALAIFSQLEDENMIESISAKVGELSNIIFRSNVRTVIILLGSCDVILGLFLSYSWISRKKWFRSLEGCLFLSLAFLLGLLRVYYASTDHLLAFCKYFVPTFVLSCAVTLRKNILGFLRSISTLWRGHKGMLVLSIMRSGEGYLVSIDSIEEKFSPVKESKEITFPQERKKALVEKVKLMTTVMSQHSSSEDAKYLNYAENVLKETGIEIYESFVPESFYDLLRAKFLLLEVEDTEIPWELMYSDNFLALKHGISRRIVSTESVGFRPAGKHRRRGLIISDPSETLLETKIECGIIHERLRHRMDVVLVEGHDANLQRIANLLGQGFDIIHYAGHVDTGLVLSDGVMGVQDVKEFVVGAPIVFVNGCRSEDMARAFLLGGAMAYIGTLHPVHDSSAAEFAADFYDFCLHYQIGEALRRTRVSHVEKSLVWASLVMYGDPTLKLL
jgi:hypothetical protein